MSLVFQMMSLGKGMTGKASGAGTANQTNVQGTSAAGLFSQTLIQTLGNQNPDGKLSESAINLQSLAAVLQGGSNSNQSSDAEPTTLGDLVEEIIPELGKLDDAIESDPALLAALQGWLTQAVAVLSGNDQAEPEQQTELTALAGNPATLRFAVQDQLNNLAAVLKEATSAGNETANLQAQKLLARFASIVEPYMGETQQNPVEQSAVPAQALVAKEVDQLQQGKNVKVDSLPAQVLQGNRNPVAANAAGKQAETAVSSTDNSDPAALLQELKASLSTAAKESSSGQDGTLNQDDSSKGTQDDSKVVTAGQLLMKDGITGSVKAEIQQPVPVRKFHEEMTKLITGKFEIIKKDGVAEATISLFPENLGQVDVKITLQNGQIVAQFMTEHSSAKSLLENQMSQLRAALQSQGLQVEKLEVTQNTASPQSQLFQEGRQSGSGGQQNSERRSKERKVQSEDAILTAELDAEWKEWRVTERENLQSHAGQFSAEA
ncbi:flagellar hook-length control protein FliK [Paenibacillus sp. HN-1]|uniref:flagellar hook-length control protein FliK n=1 Tax=Paenibacillus TaxID=44249 RepID=UPI001CA84C97|nr:MULTISPECIES: flagellar hook-length control protein FliK [Paenibacillus]MBY9081887.1 flagellar hook-length control protein FliK [Paenibacillus sp. CGMCC 1.18879]MBY9085955.1 flagellar hook-length control protein FliK [Paenibacillus sinensis]